MKVFNFNSNEYVEVESVKYLVESLWVDGVEVDKTILVRKGLVNGEWIVLEGDE